MSDILAFIASAIHAVVPEFVRLPSLTFEMPHVLYWSGLVFFPLIALYLVRRESQNAADAAVDAVAGGAAGGKISQPIAWMFWLTAGFVGLHRFYLRASALAYVYIALFSGVLYGNKNAAESRELVSKARDDWVVAEFDVEDFQKAVENGVDGAAEKLAQAKQALEAAGEQFVIANNIFEMWGAFSGTLAVVILILLLADAARMGRLTRRCAALDAERPRSSETTIIERSGAPSERDGIRTRATDIVDGINGKVGRYIAMWSIVAVFVYYYEVVARYVFNSPTNWAHESMFLMFGMQYLLSGGFALREDSHVRVDVVYENFSEHSKAVLDVVSSFFFFVFTVTLMVTGAIFAGDSIEVMEVSFTEWGIQYWPVKIAIVVGAFLLFAQGLAKLSRDVLFLRGVRAS